MIRSLTRSLISLVALVGLAGTAQAAYVPATWSDTYDVGTGVYIGSGQSYGYWHDITSDGFNVGSDLVDNFKLTIGLFDDVNDKWYDLELGLVEVSDSINGLFSSFNLGTYTTGWSIAGLYELNQEGTLSVTITSLFGDFVFGGSNLVANGRTNGVTSVPEPSTLALLGLGLLGIAAGARRRKTKVTR